MNKEDAEKLVNAYKFLCGAYASYSNSIMQYEQSDKNVSLSDWRKYKAYKLGYKKLHQRIIQAMAPEPVVINSDFDFEHPQTGVWWWDCPNCNTSAGIAESDNFCGRCGSPIEWQLEDTNK